MKFKVALLLVIATFVSGIVWGLATQPGTGGALSSETRSLEQMAKFITGLPPWLMFIFIFLKNVSAVLFSFAFSPLLLIVPVGSLVINGWLIGAVANTVVKEHSLAYFLRGVVPHGIIELPALFIGEDAALCFGFAVIQAVFVKSKREPFNATLKTSLKYVLVATALFLPAALIETFVTPRFLAS
jgi:stage II sporulation protein M